MTTYQLTCANCGNLNPINILPNVRHTTWICKCGHTSLHRAEEKFDFNLITPDILMALPPLPKPNKDTKFKIIAYLIAFAILTLWVKGPQIAQSLGNGLAPRFITVYDSSQFDHTTGKWEVGDDGKRSKRK